MAAGAALAFLPSIRDLDGAFVRLLERNASIPTLVAARALVAMAGAGVYAARPD
jgi:hypothetical protein